MKNQIAQAFLRHTALAGPLGRLFWGLAAAAGIGLAPIMASAQPVAGPAAASPAPAGAGCSVAEFRALALDTHDARLREERALKWLDAHLRDCNLAQLRALGSNRGAWLGVAETATLAGRIDGAIERRIQDNPDEVKALFSPAPAPAESVQSTASAETPITPRARIVGPGTPAVAGAPGAASPVPVPIPVPVPVPIPPAPVQPPSPPAPPAFADEDRRIVRNHYEASVVAGDCPPLLQPREGVCQSVNPVRLWRLNAPLPVTSILQDLPGGLLMPILKVPNIRVVRLGVDILLIDPDRRVLDAILDLGSPRAANARPARSG
jgi:hypothetical protein